MHKAILLLIITGTLWKEIVPTPQRNPKILIIGAGPSGIAAASRLVENGLTDITIFEAENRIGGRINSVQLGENFVDLGAQWCHGQKDNVVYNMCKDLDLLDVPNETESSPEFYRQTGQLLNQSVVEKLFEIFEDINRIGSGIINIKKFNTQEANNEGIKKEEPNYKEINNAEANNTKINSEKTNNTGNEVISLRDYFTSCYNKKVEDIFGNDQENLKIASDLLGWFQKELQADEGARDWNEAYAYSYYVTCEGHQEITWKGKGYKEIFEVLMKGKEQINEKIVLNKPVEKITWNTTSLNSKVTVTCTDKTTKEFDHVIITVSLGVLQNEYKTLFEPELPLYKQNVINSLTIGLVNKIILKFSKRWWPEDSEGFGFVWSDEDRADVIKEFPVGPEFNNRSWLESISGFHPIDSHDDVLLGWIVGDLGEIIEEMSDEVIGEASLYLLNRFVGKNYGNSWTNSSRRNMSRIDTSNTDLSKKNTSETKEYQERYEISNLDKILRSRWYSNKHFRGSYTFTSVEEVKSQVTREELAAPLLGENEVPLVCFAGEATNSIHFSTVHGAIETGFREADRISKLYQKQS